MTASTSTAAPPDRAFNLRSVLPMLLVDMACPYLPYRFLREYAPGIPIVFALALSGVFPALGNIVSLVRNRTLDIIGIIVLTGIAVSIIAAFVGGDPKVVLIRESLVTGALGVVCLLSLLWPRPLLFYIGREFSAGHDPARIAQFNALWQRANARRTFRIMTVVWGLGWAGEFLAKVGEVLILWTIGYARRARQRAAESPATAPR